MPQRTGAASSRAEQACPGEQHARPDTPAPSIGRRTGRLSTNDTPRRRHDGVHRALESIRSGRCGGACGRGGVGTLPRVREIKVREDLPHHRGIVQRGNQAHRCLMNQADQVVAPELPAA